MSLVQHDDWALCASLPDRERRGPTTADLRWFREEVQPYETTLRRYLQRRFPTLTDVDDIVQETYVRLFRERRAGKNFEARSYLFPIARNLAIDVFRRSRSVAIGGLGEIAALGEMEERRDAAEAASVDQELELLREALRRLPPRCREVFALRRLHGLTHREIAARLGVSENTVDAQLCTAIFRCRQFFVASGAWRGRVQPMPARESPSAHPVEAT